MSRRMISADVILSDGFLDLSDAAKVLYIILQILADDDGVIKGHRNALRLASASEDDFQELVDSGLVLAFCDGSTCITDWLIHNAISARYYRRKAPVQYREALRIKPDGRYTLNVDDPSAKTIDEYRGKISAKARHTDSRDAEHDMSFGTESPQDSCEPDACDEVLCGNYSNVSISLQQYDSLISQYGDAVYAYINQLSAYLHRTGDILENHYDALKVLSDKFESDSNACWTDADISSLLHGSFTEALAC